MRMELISFPNDMSDVDFPIFGIINIEYMKIHDLLVENWNSSAMNGWIGYSDCPCTLDLSKLEKYQGIERIGIFAPARSRSNMTCLWTTHSGGMEALLYQLAKKLKYRCFSIFTCKDWSDPNAMAYFSLLDGSNGFIERIVRVMRNDAGKLEFFQVGPLQDFEKPEHYSSRLLKNRLPADLLEEYCRHFGATSAGECATVSDGLVFARGITTPVLKSNIFSRIG